MVWLLILLFIAIIANLIFCIKCENRDNRMWLCYFTLILSVLLSILIGSYTKVEPLDIYRGKTELKITEERVNGIVTKRDSVVIYKNR